MLKSIVGILLFVLISTLSVDAQDLMVDGAEWHYNIISFGAPGIGVNRSYIEGDTIIEERDCLIFIQDQTNCNGRPARNYLYKEDDQVYFFDEDDASFKILYDFSLEVGDTFIYETGVHSWDLKRRTHYIRVDSIAQFSANSMELKLFEVSYGFLQGDDLTFYDLQGQIIEGIGNTINFFHHSDGTGFCDDKYSDSLRCFSSPGFSTVSFDGFDCLTVPIVDVEGSNLAITAFPNPFQREVSIAVWKPIVNGKLDLRDFAGRSVYQGSWPSFSSQMTLDLGGLPSGMYWVELTHSNPGSRFVSKHKLVKVD